MNNNRTQQAINKNNYQQYLAQKEKRNKKSVVQFYENSIETWSPGLAIYLLSEKQYDIEKIERNPEYKVKNSIQNMIKIKLSKEGTAIEQIRKDVESAITNRALINPISLGTTMLNIINTYFVKEKTFTPVKYEIN